MSRRVAAALLAAVTLAACGGGSKTAPGPTLPSEQPGEPVAAQSRPAAPGGEDTAPAPGKEEPDPWAGRTDLIQPPPPAKPAAVALPKVERFTLDNGLKVLVVAGHDLPVVDLRLAILSGERDVTKDKRDVPGFVATMLTKGTKQHDADQIAKTIEFVGGSLGAAADLEGLYVNCSALAKDLPTCMSLLAEVVVQPTFPEKEMPQVADQLIGGVKQLRDNPESLVRAHLDNAFWGDEHVRGWTDTIEAVQAVQQKDLVEWHKKYFAPGNAMLAVAGDVDAAALKAQLNKAFAAWKGGKGAPAKKLPDPKLKGVTVRLVDKADLNQAQIAMASVGVAHKDPDYLPTSVMAAVLGSGQFSSRLMKAVRVQGGKTYAASAGFERWKSKGMFLVGTFTRNAEVASTLAIVLGEIKKMREAGPTADELAEAKSNIAGQYPGHFETASDVANAVLSAELHGLGEDYVRNYPLKIDAVTLEQAKAAARKHLDADNLVIAIVGKADEIKPQLEKAGYKVEVVSYLEPISKAERDARKQEKGAAVDPKKTEAGKKLLEAALAAKGGEAKLKALKDVRALGKVQVSLGGQSAEGDWLGLFAAPDRLRLDVSLPKFGMTVTQVIAPTGSWQAAGPNVQKLPQEMSDAAVAALWREHDVVLLRGKEPGTVVQGGGKEKVNGQDYDVVQVRKADGSNATKLLLDAKTHQLFRLVYEEDGQEQVEEYADYKMVDGISFAHKQHVQGGKQSFDVTVKEIKVNGGVPGDAFLPPAPKK